MTAAPAVLNLISEGKIAILEIEGKISYGGTIPITTSSHFQWENYVFIPRCNSWGEIKPAYDVAQELYRKLASQRLGTKQLQLGDFQYWESLILIPQ